MKNLIKAQFEHHREKFKELLVKYPAFCLSAIGDPLSLVILELPLIFSYSLRHRVPETLFDASDKKLIEMAIVYRSEIKKTLSLDLVEEYNIKQSEIEFSLWGNKYIESITLRDDFVIYLIEEGRLCPEIVKSISQESIINKQLLERIDRFMNSENDTNPS